jgi:hypothetical protein
MKLLKYENWISESAIAELLLESKLVYSKRFINLLNRMKSNKIASDLLNLYTKDVDRLTQNYIDTTDNKEEVSFTPDRKVQELTKDRPQTYKVIESGRYLTSSSKNDNLFAALGYDKDKHGCWAPETGTIGLITAETVSRVSGKVYVVFEEYGVPSPRVGVINKDAVETTEAEDTRLWTTSRNPIRVGRLVRAVLGSAKIPFTDKDIEDFTNQYKATYDFAKDILKQFDIITGDDIAYWYDHNNYVRGGGTLANSCMADVDKEYFKIYTENANVSLVILYGDEGKIEGEKYTAEKIKGRALLWNCLIDGTPAKFMDRIYTMQDSDVELFKQFAEKNGFWWKRNQNMDQEESICDGKTTKEARIKVVLEDSDWHAYPYLDTMSYLNENDGCLYNYPKGDGKELRDTGGGYDGYSE